MTTIKAAIESAGAVAKVADKFNISRISVYEWISKDRLPADRVIPLAEMTGWRFTPHMLDAGLYPNERDGLPDEIRDALAAADRRTLRERRAYAERRSPERKIAEKVTP